MADTGIFASTAEVERKAGVGVSAVATAEAFSNQFLAEAESEINVTARYNFSDDYASLNDDTKAILKQAATNMAAIYMIQYDMSGYTSRIEAEDMVNILRDAALRGISILRDIKARDFVNGA